MSSLCVKGRKGSNAHTMIELCVPTASQVTKFINYRSFERIYEPCVSRFLRQTIERYLKDYEHTHFVCVRGKRLFGGHK